MVQWLKLPAWKVGDRGFEPHSGLQVSKNLVPGRQCYLINLTILGRFSWPSLV